MTVYSPDERVSFGLGTYVNAFWNDFLNYWQLQNAPEGEGSLPESTREVIRHLAEFGESVRPSLFSLNVTKELEEAASRMMALEPYPSKNDSPAEALQRVAGIPPVRDAIRISLGWTAVEGLLREAEDRIPVLVELVSERDLSERARSFLDRATRLFLWGFDPECVVMCHGSMEAALAEWTSHGIVDS